MTLNTRTRCYIFLAILLIFSLAVVSCKSGDGSDKGGEDQATQPPAAQATVEKATSAEGQPTEPAAADEKANPPAGSSGVTGLFANPQESLDSYRMRTRMVQKEGMGVLGEEMTTEMAWVRDPEASHTTLHDSSGDVMMEIIVIGDDTWTSMDGETWMHTKSGTDEEAPFSLEDFQASLEDILQDLESSLKEVGQDTVDGVRCKRYTVDADFSLPFPIPEEAPAEAQQFLPKEMEGHIEGEICVADERGLPEVILRSQTTQEMTLKFASDKEEKMAYEEERELYDINEPITIEPPSEATEMPGMPSLPGGQPGGPAGEPVEVTDLDSLDSYRLELSLQMKMSTGTAMTTGYAVEWVREPPARRIVWSMGGNPMGELVWIGDAVWIKVGGSWVQGTEQDAAEHLDTMADVMTPEDDMVLAGEETVNGVRCKHYVYDFETGSTSMHKEIWVANEGDLPPVVIRGLFRMETSQMTTESEANVTDINTPITIEAPK